MAKQRARQLSDPDWRALTNFGNSLEKGKFHEYIAVLRDNGQLFRKSLVAGIGRGLGLVVGGTVIVAIVVGILALVKPLLPNDAQNAINSTTEKLEK